MFMFYTVNTAWNWSVTFNAPLLLNWGPHLWLLCAFFFFSQAQSELREMTEKKLLVWMEVKAVSHVIREKIKRERRKWWAWKRRKSRKYRGKQAWWIINWPNNNSKDFPLLPGGNNSLQSFVGRRQTPVWKRSSGTIWLEEEYVHCSAQLRIIFITMGAPGVQKEV